ncbi:2-keto-3-deoxygluconate kinase [Halobacteriales archaeon SW_12_69_24]|nr:MAG: 2-keto-3-deoxygluconate kinase [Halobacteriales archaeon SW_12_69_24]
MSDLVTFGETMVRYAPPAGDRLETADRFAVHVGGAESNVAVAAARLDTDVVWQSKLPDGPLGRRIVRTLRGQGVDPEVVWTDAGRVGVYYLEPGGRPRGTDVRYDRAGAAVTTATTDELGIDRVEAADVVYTSGITPALSDTLADTTRDLLEAAGRAGATTAVDVNYRSNLWEPAAAEAMLSPILGLVDVLFVAERDAATVFDRTGDPEAVGRGLLEAHDAETVVVTRGERPAVAVTAGGVYEQPTFDADAHDPVGSGDAFVGGFLARRLAGGTVPVALEWGAATAALARTLAGDMALVSPSEVAAVIDGAAGISR